MSVRIINILLIAILLASSCTSQTQSKLSKALAAAVKDEKVSKKKMQDILKEEANLRDEDRVKANDYALKILNVLEMGGDSSHVDVIRKQIMANKKKSDGITI
jgi:hypothetical protein